jgi:hypothetical protein
LPLTLIESISIRRDRLPTIGRVAQLSARVDRDEPRRIRFGDAPPQ